jgi:hypothetical protein
MEESTSVTMTLTERERSDETQAVLDVLRGGVHEGERCVMQMEHVRLEPLSRRRGAIHRLLDAMFQERGSPLRVSAMASYNQDALRRHRWARNFASLREAADRLVVIAREPTLPGRRSRSASRLHRSTTGTATSWAWSCRCSPRSPPSPARRPYHDPRDPATFTTSGRGGGGAGGGGDPGAQLPLGYSPATSPRVASVKME